MSLLSRLNQRYLSKLFATPEGRAHVLAQAVDGEESGESEIFDRTLAQVDDPELARLVRKHREDELRHARLFRERLQATLPDAPKVPEELRLVVRVDREAGGLLGKPVEGARGVLEAYCLLQALEERAVLSFEQFIGPLAEVDPVSARVFAEILEDERRHLKYCVAVGKRYAASEAERLEVLERMRAAEGRAFHQNQLANMTFTLGKGWIGGPVETMLWRGVRLLAKVLPLHPPTPEARAERRARPSLQPAAAA